MNILILSSDYTGNILYKRLLNEKHNVWLYNPFQRSNGISLISSIYIGLTNNIDVAVVCNSSFTKEAKIISDKKIPVFGGQEIQDKLELDVVQAEKLCRRYGVRWLKESTNLLLPLSTEIWFSDGYPLYKYIGYIKQTKFLTGDLGLDVDCESCILWSYPNREVEAVKRIFENGLFDALYAIKYTGIFSVDSILSSDDNYPYVFAIKPRLQACIISALLEILDCNIGELIYSVATQAKCSLCTNNDIACSVSISQPPYPYNNLDGLIKYETSSGINWLDARRKVGRQIRELNIKNVQYRIDGGLQGEHLETLKKINYLSN